MPKTVRRRAAPVRRKRVPTTRRRRRTRRSTGNSNSGGFVGPVRTTIARQKISTFADKQVLKLQYSSFISPTGTAFPVFQTLSMNSLFDPDVTGTGHQPLAFDQWSALYRKYTVLASRVDIRVNCNSAGANYQFVVFPNTLPPASLPTAFQNSISACREIPYAKWSQGTQIMQAKKLTHYCTLAGILGTSKSKIREDDQYSALNNASPAVQAYWIIGVQNCDEVTNTSFTIQYEIEYYCMMWDRIAINQS